jgi:alkylation response protein AidB-like acyl-CoA dehydrogenase
MSVYQPPVEHMTFLLEDVFQAQEAFAQTDAYAEVSGDLMQAILIEAGKLAEGALAPFNRAADEAGCQLVNGKVVSAPGTQQAYQTYRDGGWQGLSLPEEYGGQGLPKALQFLIDEMISGAWMSFGLTPGLTRGAIEAIEAHASQELKEQWLPKMVSGEWAGAMCLTEAQAGTDLALLRTRAEAQDDGAYAITGSKIFISAGDHDLTDNIIYLVLARLPVAPAGVKGISLFLVPKVMLDGARNGVSVGALEKKMGLKASPTCVMNFDQATGYLVGQPHQGLAAMFTMMNSERLFVGVQGIGAAEAAYQAASRYAKERMQGRDAATGKPTAIIGHADVRRMLLTARAWSQGMRALALWAALELDASQTASDPARRAEAAGLVPLMTPVVKAAGTDLGLESTILAQQVFGGHGYIREWGVEQLVRDVRITQIYEGTNGIQALDLAGRKLMQNDGALPGLLFARIEADIALAGGCGFASALGAALDGLRASTEILRASGQDPYHVGAAATAYLRQMALVTQGWMWLKMCGAAKKRPSEDPIRVSTLAVASFFEHHLLPETLSLAAVVRCDSAPVMGMPVALF